MRLHELKAFLAKTRLTVTPPKAGTFNYEDILQSMRESLTEYDMTFKAAWTHEKLQAVQNYGQPVYEILSAAGKTLNHILSTLEDEEIITNDNFYHQPFDLELERELGNYLD